MVLETAIARFAKKAMTTVRVVSPCSSVSALSLTSSSDLHARDGSGDHQSLDLRGALEDRVDPRVASHPLDRVLPGEAVAAEDLHRVAGDLDRGLAGVQLRHRALGGLEPLVVARHPCRAPDQLSRGVDAVLHVREGEGDRLVLDD